MDFWGQLVLTYLATVGFGLIINIPRHALNVAGVLGTFAWACYLLATQVGSGAMVANLIGAIAIGVGSNWAAHFKKQPSIIFNIPSLVPFVPGSQAYQMVRNFALHHNEVALSMLLQVLMITGSLALGFLIAELLNQLVSPLWRKLYSV